jgi:MFS family permease
MGYEMETDFANGQSASLGSESKPGMNTSSGLPSGVRLFAWVRAIRWFGWGFGEALLPVFIMGFSHTFVEAGLFSSTVELVSLLSLPFIGVWADKMPAKRLVLWSLLLYPMVGVFYMLAGIFSMAIFIIFARAINGFTWELENVGIATYFRRVIGRRKIATSFGYLDTLTNCAWIFSALIGMYLVTFLPIHYILFAIAPFSIAAYFIAYKGPVDQVIQNSESIQSNASATSPIRHQKQARHLWFIGALTLFSSIINCLIVFFIPINAYQTGTSLSMVVLLGIFGALPSLFGYLLGLVADKKDRYRLLSMSLFWIAASMMWLAAVNTFWFKLGIVFILGVILELISVVQSSLITTIGSATAYGKRGSIFEGISTTGDLVAPLILGAILDAIGFSNSAYVIGIAAVGLACASLIKVDT